jgi:hypothetical protein
MSRNSLKKRWALLCAAVLLAMSTVGSGAAAEESNLQVLSYDFGYSSPYIREMYLHVELKAKPLGGKEVFFLRGTTGAFVDGEKVHFALCRVGNETLCYYPQTNASQKSIDVYIPLAWRAGRKYDIALHYGYGAEKQKPGKLHFEATAPKEGGAWKMSEGGNRAFLVREPIGMARRNAPVDLDLTIETTVFPDPQNALVATWMRSDGVFEELPCQVYALRDHPAEVGRSFDHTRSPKRIFRVALLVDFKANEEKLIHLWHAPKVGSPWDLSKNWHVRHKPEFKWAPSFKWDKGGYIRYDAETGEKQEPGKFHSNAFYAITLDSQSGQLLNWDDRATGLEFGSPDPKHVTPILRGPSFFTGRGPWSQTSGWREPPGERITSGPLFFETIRWGDLRAIPTVRAKVRYRFWAAREFVRAESSFRVKQDTPCMAARMDSLTLSKELVTHGAWPLRDGSVKIIPRHDFQGNDLGSPPDSQFSFDTPWVALLNKDKGIGIAMIILKSAYFSDDGPDPINASKQRAYVSQYMDQTVYVTRMGTQTFSGHNSRQSMMPAGSVMYQDAVYTTFTYDPESKRPFARVEDLLRELKNPPVVVP